MDKRVILAIALSLLVLMSWSAIVSKVYHIDNKEVIETAQPTPTAEAPKPVTLAAAPETLAGPLVQFSQPNCDIVFIESLAAIKEVVFKMHQNYTFSLGYGLSTDGKGLRFKKEAATDNSITFVDRDKEKKITKKFTFSNSNYDIWLEISTQNISALPLKFRTSIVLGELNFSSQNAQARYQDVLIASQAKTTHSNGRKDLEAADLKFIGLRDRYFCAIIEPATSGCSGFVKKVNGKESEVGLVTPENLLAPSEQIGQKFHIYLGPQDTTLLNSLKSDWTLIVHFGTFDFISQILLQMLKFLFNIVHNWGWAIVILSALVYLLLYPLSIKQMRSMKEMQALQPKIDELRKTYKDNPQKLNKEIMQLYQQHKVNPFGGCLPLLLQMPIFFALYQALMRSVALKGAHFLWVKDLSEPDRLFILPVSLPVLGNEVNILPIVMAIGMFIQQKISMAKTGGQGAEQQKLMLIVMPLMFGLIFYHMPAGLVLYWFINSTLMLIFQLRMNRAR